MSAFYQGAIYQDAGSITSGYDGSHYYMALASYPGEVMRLVNGKIGIGTTTPYSRLTVWGPDTSANTSAFVISNSASTTEFNVLDNGNATLAGCLNYNGGTSGTCLSDERVKQDINPFTDSLQEIIGLDPVTYEYNGLAGTPSDGDARTGLIAQQVQQVAPDLVSTTSAFLKMPRRRSFSK